MKKRRNTIDILHNTFVLNTVFNTDSAIRGYMGVNRQQQPRFMYLLL